MIVHYESRAGENKEQAVQQASYVIVRCICNRELECGAIELRYRCFYAVSQDKRREKSVHRCAPLNT
jgi:hypothetical protein